MNTLRRLPVERLESWIARFGRCRIAVLGDFFLDKYFDVDPALAEVSLETGKTAHQVAAVRHSPGAAGTVVCNLAALGAGTIHAIGFTGDDGEAYDLRKDLAALGCRLEHLACDPFRATPTYLKPRDLRGAGLAGEHSRYDVKNRRPTSDELVRRTLAAVDVLLHELDVLVVLDQVEEDGCGAVTSTVVEALAERASRHPRVVFWADSRRRIHGFRQMIIKPNQFEAVGLENPSPDLRIEPQRLGDAVVQLRRRTGAPVCVTCGADGMIVSDPEPTQVPGVKLDGPLDPTGAGDSATAGAVLALAAGASLPEAALVGNLVASITVEQTGVTGTASPAQLVPRLALWQRQQNNSAPQ